MTRPRLSHARWLAPPVAALAALLSGTSLVLASTLTAGAVTQVPDNPLGGSSKACAGLIAEQEKLGSVNYPDAEVEPYVAADPANPLHLVASFQQDRWNDGGANGLTNVFSIDGGKSWHPAKAQPTFSVCEGGSLGRATDPWVSFSADGAVAYSISDSFNADGPGFGGASSILVSRSTDGGNTWQTPVTAEFDASTQQLNDKEAVTGDPKIANNAYAVWDRLVSPEKNANPSAFIHSPAFRGPALFSKTTDKGLSWSQGRVIFDPGEKDQTIGNQIVVPTAGLAKGTLVDGFDLIVNEGGKCPLTPGGAHCGGGSTFFAAVLRSTDGGTTWAGPTIVDLQQVAGVSIAGQFVRSSDELPEFATNPVNGNLYAAWQDSRFSPTGNSKIAFSQSPDGVSWSTPIRIDQSPGDTPAFVPQIEVAADGTIGLLYYDLENSTKAQPGLTDAFIAHCHSATSDCGKPASWTAGGETRLSTSGSFDYTTAPKAGGLFLGDYDGLTSSGGEFRAFFCMSQPIATHGRSDPFANTAG